MSTRARDDEKRMENGRRFFFKVRISEGEKERRRKRKSLFYEIKEILNFEFNTREESRMKKREGEGNVRIL